MPDALARVIADVDARLVVISYNDEAWVTIEDLEEMAAARGGVVRTLGVRLEALRRRADRHPQPAR